MVEVGMSIEEVGQRQLIVAQVVANGLFFFVTKRAAVNECSLA